MSSGVRFAPMMAAIRTVASASPFGRPPEKTVSLTARLMVTCASATAVRRVTGLRPTSTMRTSPVLGEMVQAIGPLSHRGPPGGSGCSAR